MFKLIRVISLSCVYDFGHDVHLIMFMGIMKCVYFNGNVFKDNFIVSIINVFYDLILNKYVRPIFIFLFYITDYNYYSRHKHLNLRVGLLYDIVVLL